MAAAVVENLSARDRRLSTAVVIPARQKVRLEGKACRELINGKRRLARHYMALGILEIKMEKKSGDKVALKRLELPKADKTETPVENAGQVAE